METYRANEKMSQINLPKEHEEERLLKEYPAQRELILKCSKTYRQSIIFLRVRKKT
ncbi:MAG: hypothetical protein ACYSSI_01405 [Planctomycetota bacterium]